MSKPTNVKFPFIDNCKWEEIAHEDLWEDGELNRHDVISKIVHRVLDIGDWKLLRRKENDE